MTRPLAISGEPTEENIIRLLADIFVYCKTNNMRFEKLILDAWLIGASEVK